MKDGCWSWEKIMRAVENSEAIRNYAMDQLAEKADPGRAVHALSRDLPGFEGGCIDAWVRVGGAGGR